MYNKTGISESMKTGFLLDSLKVYRSSPRTSKLILPRVKERGGGRKRDKKRERRNRMMLEA